jgi:hypothetical protein
MAIKEMVFFHAGETVQLKQDIPHKPKMVVKRIVKSNIGRDGDKKKPTFMGVKCFWFGARGEYYEVLFNSKDLEKID